MDSKVYEIVGLRIGILILSQSFAHNYFFVVATSTCTSLCKCMHVYVAVFFTGCNGAMIKPTIYSYTIDTLKFFFHYIFFLCS